MRIAPPVIEQRWIMVGEGPFSRDLLDSLAQCEASLPVCVVVSDESRISARANGMPVGGSIEHIPQICRRLRVEQVVIVVDDIGDDLADRAAHLARECGLQVQYIESVRGKPHHISDLDAMLADRLRATA